MKKAYEFCSETQQTGSKIQNTDFRNSALFKLHKKIFFVKYPIYLDFVQT